MLGSLKLRQLHLLVALDDNRKLSVAAERLNMSQSAASKMLAEIEIVAGATLFERSSRGLEPTTQGRILIRGGRAILADLDQTARELAKHRMGEAGIVSVGAVAALFADLIIDVIQYLGAKLDQIEIALHVDISPSLIERLIALELDFAVARLPAGVDPRQFDYHEIGEEEARLLVRTDHPLAECKLVSFEEMRNVQWVMQQRGSFMRQCVERMFMSHAVPAPHRVIDTDSFFASLAIAARTDAIVPIPMHIFDLIDRSRFTTLEFGGRMKLESYGLLKLKDRPLSPAATIVFEAMNRCRLSSLAAIAVAASAPPA
jgi:DNA-binding transcriptional LysR family regulator